MDTILGLIVGYAVCKLFGTDFKFPDLFGVKHVEAKKGSDEVKHYASDTTTTSIKYASEQTQPGGLPPWPSGWKVTTVTPAIVDRAWKLLPTLKDGERKVEMGPNGVWLSYFRSLNPKTKKHGVTVFEPKVPASADKVTV